MNFNSIRIVLISATICLFTVFIMKPYFFLDEPNILWEIKRGTVWTGYFNRFISEGRPFYGWIQLRFMEMAGSMAGLRLLRITGVVLSILFLLVIFNFLNKWLKDTASSFLYVVLVFCLPGFSLFMMWSECFPQHFSSLLSFFAGVFTLKVFAWLLQEERLAKSKENLYIFYALLLQIISLLNYQGMALVFILPGFFVLLSKHGVENKMRMRFFYNYLLIFFISLGVYYLIYKSMLAHYQIGMVGRGKIGNDYIGKLKWFIEIWLKASTLHLFLLKPFLIQRLLSFFILFLILYDLYKKRFTDVFFLFAFCVLSFLPHLLIAESWGATRNFVLMSMVILFYAILRSSALIPFLKQPQSIVLTLPFLILLFINSYYAFLKPVTEDYQHVYSKVQELPVISQDSVVIQVKLPAYNLHEKTSFLRSYCDEFNVSPLFYEWPVTPSIKCFYSERHPEMQANKIDELLKVYTKDSVLRAGRLFWDYNYK